MNFGRHNIESYNHFKKQLNGFITIFSVLAVIAFIATYFLVLRKADWAIVHVLNAFVAEITYHVNNGTTLGSLYASFFGGLFFVFLPMEVLFLKFMEGNNPVIVIALYNLGFVFSFTANYYIGMRLTEFSKKMISLRKFYKLKSVINKWGGWAVFGFNAIPFFPAQPLSAILGVFKYNMARFYFYFLLGQILKYSAITIGYFYIL